MFALSHRDNTWGRVSPATSELNMSNQNTLALPELDQKATQAFIYCLESFVRSEPEQAKQFIRQFYCDPFYQFGVYQLHKHRQEIRGHLHIELEPFSQAFPQRNIPDGHINFLLKHSPDYLPLTDLFESLAHNFNVCGSDWPTSYYFTILKLRVAVLADVNAAVKAIAD